MASIGQTSLVFLTGFFKVGTQAIAGIPYMVQWGYGAMEFFCIM
jgi:hypothetical protein